MACIFTALWLGGFALLFRVVPAPEPTRSVVPVPMSWWPAEENRSTPDIRTIWTPSAFALASPAGFSHSLRAEQFRLQPPVQSTRPAAAFLQRSAFLGTLDMTGSDNRRQGSSETSVELLKAPASVFPPRIPEKETPRIVFPEGWESRLFSGIDLNFNGWTNRIWSARVEMQFDSTGVPVSMILAQSSGLPEMDRRLARSTSGWRLLDSSAPRRGVVSWISPGGTTPAPEPASRSVAVVKEVP